MIRHAHPTTVEPTQARGREVLFEIIVRGNAMRCAAIDAATGVEVITIGPAGASEAQVKALALRKLRRRMDLAR
jgi:hypothetical protein